MNKEIFNNELNKLNAKLIKAELIKNEGKIKECKDNIEKLKQEYNNSKIDENKINELKLELNTINAKLIKAEILGNNELINDYKQKIIDLESNLKNYKNSLENTQQNEDRKLINHSKNVKNQNTSKTIQVIKKLNENNMTLKQMFVKEHRTSVEDETKKFITSASSITNENEYDDFKFTSKKRKKENEYKYEEIKNDEENCNYCLTKIKKHLLLNYDDNVYISIPEKEPLVKYQLQIKSNSHFRCLVSASENCIESLNEFKKIVCDMFTKKNLNVIFTETFFKHQIKWKKHFQINCFPISSNLFEESKIYFKKAILECEEEWSNNKKLIILKGSSVEKLIPKNLPYFFVTFGYQNDGFAHVIETEEKFSKYFAEEIIGGLLDIEPYKWLNSRNLNFDKQVQILSELKQLMACKVEN